jgi:hypothetical protein
MIGLVLWYNPKAQVGVIWCEDQGPLAYLGPEVALPKGLRGLVCGDQLIFSFDLSDGVRLVRSVSSVSAGVTDPAEILAGHHRQAETAARLRVVA